MFLGTVFFVENHAKKGEINLMKRTKFHTDNTKAIKWALLQACEKAILHSNLYAVYITESKVGKVIFNLINYKCLQQVDDCRSTHLNKVRRTNGNAFN